MQTQVSATAKHTNRISKHTTVLQHHMVRTPSQVSAIPAGRWSEYITNVTEVHAVEMWTTNPSFPAREEYKARGFEFVTPYGRGLIMAWRDGADVVAFIPNNTATPTLFHGAWKKRGSWVHWGMDYIRAQGFNPASKKVYHSCPAHIYDAAMGKRATNA